MIENGFRLPDDITDKEIEQVLSEIEQKRKQIELHLWKKGYGGYEIISYGGLLFISNKAKTKPEQLKWLRKYSEVLRTYGIDATVYNDRNGAYICF